MEIFGIKFVPLRTPLKIRLQTFAAAIWFSVIYGNILTAIFFLYLFFTTFWWINIMYLFWFYFDWDAPDNGGHYKSWMLKWKLWYHLKEYFPARLVRTPGFELDPKRNYLFCCFPHGIMPSGPWINLATHSSPFYRLYSNFLVKTTTLPINFYVPFFRDHLMALGTISCSRKSLNFVLSKPEGGHIVLLWPGGAEEALYSGNYTFVIKNRKGFVRVALQNGSPLVPVITFGEIDLFHQFGGEKWRKFQRMFKRFVTYVPVIFNGRGYFQYSFGLIPKQKPLTTILAAPIEVSKVENPTDEQVEDLHQKFVQELVKLFEENKHKYVEDPENTVAQLL